MAQISSKSQPCSQCEIKPLTLRGTRSARHFVRRVSHPAKPAAVAATKHHASPQCLFHCCTRLIPLRSKTQSVDERSTQAWRSSSARCHRQSPLPRLLRITTLLSSHSTGPAPMTEPACVSMGLSKDRVVPFVVAWLRTSRRSANGSTVRGVVINGQRVTTALPCTVDLIPPRLDLRPEHRSGSRRTFYSGHTPGTTCWRVLTPPTQPHPRLVTIFIP